MDEGGPDASAIDRWVRSSFGQQGIMALLGAELIAAGAGSCAIRLAWRPDLTQQDGFFHAGVVATIADSAAGYAAFSLMPAGARVLTVEFKINLLAPARGEYLVATGIVQRAGRTLGVVQARVMAFVESRETEVALMQATTMCLLPDGGRRGTPA